MAMATVLTLLPLALQLSALNSPGRLCGTTIYRRGNVMACAAPTLREQMQAYIKSVQERGVELTPEQKAMMAEFQEDDELLDQRGLSVDFMKGAKVMTPEEYAAQEGEMPAPALPFPAAVPAATPGAAAPAMSTPVSMSVADVPVDAATARLWLMQQGDRDKAVQYLSKRVAGMGLNMEESKELRRALASLIVTLAAA
mmetsp:Transcript_40272/g.106659  ORF Transcript_40272/g.106659 Transcript_40272/m.106659 type:complete len:198 (-) Transcript_40272:365-958(-)|eukprot:CAMPEP_0115854998 /NCGR_PEP_ID=MMETSP0287-20121206/14317_1 /TAXON_ID=412157 /ORGANISM="Chrysochromulina rotalis, Strain UIO044" /LENGTH=197 /DNA_ID=CAMNT_0003309141 /DNA_START=48 /DNA_END=641 /DNA_ORIENTATION=-